MVLNSDHLREAANAIDDSKIRCISLNSHVLLQELARSKLQDAYLTQSWVPSSLIVETRPICHQLRIARPSIIVRAESDPPDYPRITKSIL